jgi:LysM repeat protein
MAPFDPATPTTKERITMGLFDRFRKSYDDKVQEAISQVNGMNLGVSDLGAKVDGKFVTLTGEAPSMDVKAKVMEAFNELVETENTLNTIRVVEAAPAEPAPAPEPEETIYEVVSGDTLGAIAQKYYGKASLYMKIFDANRDILDDPDLIKVGQKLKIPKLEG